MSNDRSYLGALQDYYARHRALPSYASIGSLLGLRSKSSVAALVARMKLAGYLESTPDRRLAPTKRFFARALASGFVRAGLPDAIADDEPDAVTLDDYLIERPSQTVLVRVKGDSMMDAGIFEGDLVVVEKRAAAQKERHRRRHRRQPVHVEAPGAGEWTLRAETREQGLSDDSPGRRARDLRRDGRARAQAVTFQTPALRWIRAPLLGDRAAPPDGLFGATFHARETLRRSTTSTTQASLPRGSRRKSRRGRGR